MMKSRIRETRRARGLTLQQVAERCVPPTTAQTIGRLEQGNRTLSVAWLNRIASALGVEAAELVALPPPPMPGIDAVLGPDGAVAAAEGEAAAMSITAPPALLMRVDQSVGEYRAGDLLWLERITADGFGRALNRDILVPRPGGRFAFGRLTDRQGNRLHLVPPGQGQRQIVVADALWIAMAVQLLRQLA
jgi:transcriptional regulator with XRE-family HTH domain